MVHHVLRHHGCADGDEARQDHQEWEEHFRNRGDERNAARRFLRVGCHGRLDDEEIRTPVAEGEHKAEAGHEGEPIDAEGIGIGAAHSLP